MTAIAPSASTPNSPLSAKRHTQDAIFFRGATPLSPVRPIKSINDLNREYSDISIRVDPSSATISRRNSDVSLSDFRPSSRFAIHHSLDYERELVRRQFAMIATQPMNTSEEIDEKRRLLRMKVESRKRADEITKAAGSLGRVGIGNIQSVNKSPSPIPIIPKVVISKSKDKAVKAKDQHLIPTKGPSRQVKAPLSPRKGPKNATQAAKVMKKVVSGANKSIAPKITK